LIGVLLSGSLISGTFVFTEQASATPPVIGSKCSLLGAVAKKGSRNLICTKKGKSMIWIVLGSSSAKASPSPSPRPTVNSSPKPSPTPTNQSLQIISDFGSKNLTRIQIDPSRRVVVGCNGSQIQDPAVTGRLLLAFSTHNAVSSPNLFLNSNYNPKSWVGSKPNFLNGILPYITLTNASNANLCTYTSSPIPNVVKDIASDIQSIGLFYEPTTTPGRLTHLGTTLVNRVATKGVLDMTRQLPRIWCLLDDPAGLIGTEQFASPVIVDNQMKEYKKPPNWQWSLLSPNLPEAFTNQFKSSRAWGFYYDLSSTETSMLQGTSVNCKFTGKNVFGDSFTVLDAIQIPKVSVQKDFFADGGLSGYPQPTWGDDWIQSTIRCEVRSYSGYHAQTSFISVLDPAGNQLIRERFSGAPSYTGGNTAERTWYSVKTNEMIKNSGKTYYCLFDLTGLDGSKVSEKLPVTVTSIIKSPLPKPQTVIQSIGRDGLGEVGCFLTNWQDYSLGVFVPLNSNQSSFAPTSKVTLLRDDGSVVRTSGFSWQYQGRDFIYLTLDKSKYYLGLFFSFIEFSREIARADGKRYTCQYEMVGFNGEKLVHNEIVQMPFKN